ncbi:MAG: hypothetical protein HYU36_09650 [Planctomycetes bacterium]|nr:hypothetical protein [Planctomycetota bacterium]
MKRRDFVRSAMGAVILALGGAAGYAASLFLSRGTRPQGERRKLGPEFTYDLKAFQTTPPELVHYEESTRWDLSLRVARSVHAGADDLIRVAGDRVVQSFRPNGDLVSEIPIAGLPQCLEVTPEGDLLVGLKDHVEVYNNSEGKLKASWERLGPDAVLKSIAVAGDNVYAADAGQRIVLRFDRSGRLLGRIGVRDEARSVPGFVIPSPFFCVRPGPGGLLWVSNPGRHRLEAYTPEGDLESWWGRPSMALEGFCGCCNPVSFDLLPGGRFVTAEKGLPRVKVYRHGGDLEGVVAGPEAFPENAQACAGDVSNCTRGGLAVSAGPSGRITLLDPVARNVRLMSPKTRA